MDANAVFKVAAEMELDASPDCRFAVSEAKVKRWAEQLRSAARGGGEAVAVVAQVPSMQTIIAIAEAVGAEFDSNAEAPDMPDAGEPWATFTPSQLTEFVDRLLQVCPALATPPAPAIPEGWRWVPVEPTDETIRAGDVHMECLSDLSAAWESMLAAAPSPEVAR